MRILMVCLGNICRSPLAEGILKSKESNFIVDSAGTSGHHNGEAPDIRSIEVANKYGIDISKQQSRKFTVADFDNFDIIFTMDKSNYTNVIKLARNNVDKQKTKLILNEVNSNLNQEVPDPYYGGDNGFEKVYAMLEEACNNIVSKYS